MLSRRKSSESSRFGRRGRTYDDGIGYDLDALLCCAAAEACVLLVVALAPYDELFAHDVVCVARGSSV